MDTLETLEALTTITHGTPAGYAAGCQSEGACPNHNDRHKLTCTRAARARRSDYRLARLDPNEPITREMIKIPHQKAPAAPQPAQPPAPVSQRPARASRQRAPRRIPKRAPTTKPVTPSRRREQVHGTDYGWQRGCRDSERCPAARAGGRSCLEAHLAYHRSYRAARAAGRGPEVVHGTPYGYQMGCHNRAGCPGGQDGTTCADASLAAERERRRRAGTPAAAELTEAAPVVEHVGRLHSAGMSLPEIAVAARCGLSAIRSLVYGRSDAGHRCPTTGQPRVPRRIAVEKARRILAVSGASRPEREVS